MKNLRNSVHLIGRLGLDPEVKELSDGKKMARLSLATNEDYRGADGKKVTNTQWHQLVAWGPRAKFAEDFLKKGKEIAVEGSLKHRSYEDTDGNSRYVTEVVVNNFIMLGSKPDK